MFDNNDRDSGMVVIVMATIMTIMIEMITTKLVIIMIVKMR